MAEGGAKLKGSKRDFRASRGRRRGPSHKERAAARGFLAGRAKGTLLLAAAALLGLGANLRLGAQNLAQHYSGSAVAAGKSVTEAVERGEDLRRRWKLESADAAFREATTIDPANLDAELGLARIARVQFEYGAAMRFLDAALKSNSRSAAALAEYGLIYLTAEDPERARDYFARATKIEPGCATAIIGQAGVDLLERNYAGAETMLREFIGQNSQDSHAHAMLARALLENNKNAEAVGEAERALALDPYDTDAMHSIAFVKATEHKTEEVRALARRALALDPRNSGVRRLLSQYLDGQAGYKQRVGDAARAHWERGRAIKHDGKLDEAVAEFEAALRLEPRYYRALIALGDVWLRQGDYERAAAAAAMATAVDADGAVAHLELSYANRGLQERARIQIGAEDFAAEFYRRVRPPAHRLTSEIFPDYRSLTREQQIVIDATVAPLSGFLPRLARKGARHYLLSYDDRVGDLGEFGDVTEEKTFDGRYYASIRGVGGRTTVSGIEYIEIAASGGFNTIAHEFAHQVHMTALGKEDARAIHRLYERALREGRVLDYYAAANEYEYFAQGYEAYVSERKRPSASLTARHSNRELLLRDPELYRFFRRITKKSGAERA